MSYMIQYSKCDEDELFKICLEFWQFFAQSTYEKLRVDASKKFEFVHQQMYPQIF